MEAIMMPVVVLGITGILMGLFLAYASKKFEVEVDPKVEAILAVLPGANCGACGFPGCAGYASGVALEGAKMTLCAPGGPKVIEKIGEIMGVAVEIPVKKKPVKKTVEKKVVAQTGDPISASAEFIEKNKRMLNKFKDAFDAGDKEAYEKLENLAKTAGKDELLKYYEEIKTGKIIPDGSAPAAPTGDPISASAEFIEKNKRMLNKFKDAFDAKDKEAYEKLENLAKTAGKDELLKCFEEIKAGKIIASGSAPAAAAVKLEPITATKEFVENISHEEFRTEEEIKSREENSGKLRLRLKYNEEQVNESYITKIIRKYDVEVNILGGFIDKVGDIIVGNLLIEISANEEKAKDIIEWLKENKIDSEVV